ncbi:MAG: protein kinase [Kofleriaceae bacterium]
MGALGKLGRYELITRIGQGGMAEVQLALQRGPAGFEKLVVVKLVHAELATQKAFVDMLLDEARVAALVKHPNVVDIYDLGEADGKYFIAMEYLEGEPLLSVLRAGREGKRLDALSTGRLIADTADGLDAAHELRNMAGERIELVHHDISLGNIVVLYNGSVKLVDFGVAKATSAATGSTGKVQGKFSYMAPEKLKGSPGDRRSDIFSLGCVLWEALTLKRLFRGGNDAETMKQVLELAVQPPSKVNSDVPVGYDAIVMRSLDRDPAKRQQTAKQLANEIEELLHKSGYEAKNDRIGKYMQETFKDHIDARKKLVQEVVSKGSASAETVDAAFHQAAQLANGSPRTPTMGDFSIMRPLPRPSVPLFVPTAPTVPKAVPKVPTVPKVITPTAFVPDAFSDQNRPTEISSSPFETHTDGGITEIAPPPIDPDVPEIPPPIWPNDAALIGPPPPSRIVTVMDWVEDVANDRHKRMIAIVVGSGALFLILVFMLVKCGGHADKPVVAHHGAAPVVIEDAEATVQVVTPIDAAIAVLEPDAAIVAPPPDAGVPVIKRPIVVEHRPVVPPQSADTLFQKALQAYVKGDLKTALALLKTAKATSPGHAATWRLLGQVYKKLGDHAQAKAAFTRYLVLAPNASDAATIRHEVE